MIILSSTLQKLQAVLGASPSTELPIVASYGDHTSTTYTPGAKTIATNGTTAVDIVDAPAASTQRQVKFLSAHNPNGSAVTLTIRYSDNGTNRTLRIVTLAAGDTLYFLDTIGFYVLDSSGQIKQTGSGGSSSPTTTKGDIEVHNGTTLDRLGVGTLLQGILADSSQATGLKWGDIVSVLGRSASQLDIVNTTTETAILSMTVPANVLRTDRTIRFTIFGDYLNNTGSNQNFTLRVKYGATTMYADATAAIPTSANRYGVSATLLMTNQGAENSQVLGGLFHIGNQGATTGIGDLGTDETPAHVSVGGTAAEDSTSGKTLEVSIQHGAANASLSFRRQSAIVELV